MRYFSMFSGVGGFELGIGKATDGRWACVGYSEIDKYAIKCYKKNFPNHRNYGDARQLDPEEIPDFDVLVGGFPCQAFSIAGEGKGFGDTRGTLFFEIARVITRKQPRTILLENVKGLVNHDSGRTFAKILSTMDELGYDAEWQVLNSKDFLIPQNRERVFIIGHLRGKGFRQVFPIGTTADETIIFDEPEKIMIDVYNKRFRNECPTLTDPCHNSIRVMIGKRIRKLTPIEYERFQAFPDRWTEPLSDSQRYKCMGNAVTTNVIEAIVSQLEARKK